MPFAGVDVNVWLEPEHTSAVGGLIEHVGFGFIESVPEQIETHPFESVIVSVYVPAVLTVMHEFVDPLLHLCVNGPVPPFGVPQNCCDPPAHTSAVGGVIEHVGFGLTIRVAWQVVLHPFESVTESV